jgi:hypothetical protein
MSIVEASWVPKETSRRPMPHYDARLIRRIDVEHNDLASTIDTIQAVAEDFVDFLPLGKLSVTLCDLNPVVRNALKPDKKGNIEEYAKKYFEQEIIETVDIHTATKIVAPAGGDYSFGLFGRWQETLGIRLKAPNPLLIGERFIAESYIKDVYGAGPRFGTVDLMEWEPYIALGHVNHEKLSAEHRYALQDDTSGFIAAIVENPERLTDSEYAPPHWAEPIEVPDIALGGLRIVCDKQPERVF